MNFMIPARPREIRRRWRNMMIKNKRIQKIKKKKVYETELKKKPGYKMSNKTKKIYVFNSVFR